MRGESIKGIVYGHVVSRNLLQWAHMPVAIWNDQAYDRYAIYSGSARPAPAPFRVSICAARTHLRSRYRCVRAPFYFL